MTTFPIGTKVTADTASFVGNMAAGTRALTTFREGVGLASSALTVLAGGAALGLAADKALDFRSQMLQLNTLVGLSLGQIDELTSSVMSLSEELGKGPQELAEGLLTITSAGITDTAQAMEILEQSAKASAIGLGDIGTIGRAATAALQAFGDSGLTAKRAIDLMMATVNFGNLEASELAGTFGRVIAIADQMGVSFAEVGSFVATFTRLGVDASEATTALRATLTAIMDPAVESRAAFDAIGISIDEMRNKIKEDGLTEALIDMLEASQGNLDVIGNLIPNVRALAGVLGTAGSQAQSYRDITAAMNGELDLTNQGVAVLKEEGVLAFKEFAAAVERAQIELGTRFLPLVTDGIGLLTETVDELVIAFQALMAAGIVNFIGRLVTVLRGAALGATAFKAAVGFLGGPWVAALTIAAAIVTPLILKLRDAKEEAEGLNEEREKLASGNPFANWAAQMPTEELERLRDMMEADIDFSATPDAGISDRVQNLIDKVGVLNAELNRRKQLEEDIAERNQDDDAHIQTAEETEAVQRIIDKLVDQRDKLILTEDALIRASEAYRVATAAQREHIEALMAEIAAAEQAAATQDLIDSLVDQRDALKFSTTELVKLSDAYLNASAEQKKFIDQLLRETEILNARTEVAQLTEQLESQLNSLVMTETQLIRTSDAYRAATESERAYIDGLLQQIAAAESADEAAKIVEEAATRQERVMASASMRMTGDVQNMFETIIMDSDKASDAIRDMVNSMLREIARLTFQKTVAKPIAEFFSSFLSSALGATGGGATPGAAFGGAIKAGQATTVGELGREVVVPAEPSVVIPLSGPRAVGGGQQVVVQQNITFAPRFVDARDGTRFIREHATDIAEIISRGVRTSSGFARQLTEG